MKQTYSSDTHLQIIYQRWLPIAKKTEVDFSAITDIKYDRMPYVTVIDITDKL